MIHLTCSCWELRGLSDLRDEWIMKQRITISVLRGLEIGRPSLINLSWLDSQQVLKLRQRHES